MRMNKMIIFSSCTARKRDDISIPKGAITIQPTDYLDDKNLIKKLSQTRQQILEDPKAHIGTRSTYAFDLYVNTGNAYRELRAKYYERTKSLLISRKIEWFFLSGGYGIINALEPAKKYQATFNRSISYMKKIPFTANLWRENLTEICENIIAKVNPERFYTFGSQDYTNFVKKTHFWKSLSEERIGIKVFESTGSAGPYWISKILGELAEYTEKNNLDLFDEKYPQFIKQMNKN